MFGRYPSLSDCTEPMKVHSRTCHVGHIVAWRIKMNQMNTTPIGSQGSQDSPGMQPPAQPPAEPAPAQGGPATATAAPPRPAPDKPKVDQLPPYRVLLHNDDVNSQEFVVSTLLELTPVKRVRAVEIMLEADRTGVSLVMVTHRELAEMYQDQLRSKGLTVTIEAA